MDLGDLFDQSLIGRRSEVGLDVEVPQAGVVSLTFGEIDERAGRMAAALSARGVRRGDRVGVHLANRVEVIDLFLACLRLGAIFVPINVLYRARELAHIAADATPALIVTEADHRPFFPAGSFLVEVGELAREAAGAGAAPVRLALSPDDPAAIVYTSGTTGRAKGAVLSHRNFAANTANLVTGWRITSADRYLAVLPLFHVHGLGNGLCTWLASGCRMRLAPRFDHARALDLFEEFGPTLFFGVPTMYVRLLDFPADRARRIGGRGRLFVSGSAPLPAHVHSRFAERFGHTILERYGMSETLMLTSNPYEGERRAGTVGVPLPGVATRIVNESGEVTAHDVVGELQVRGPNVFSRYWNDAAATSAAFTDDGWFRTGDLAERSADGYFTLRGRGTDLIISGGFNIYPREVEELLLEQPGVREAVVVGVPDERRGEVPVAYVVTDERYSEPAVRAACAGALASFKTPRAFVCVDALPRNALGKVQRHLLPAWSAR